MTFFHLPIRKITTLPLERLNICICNLLQYLLLKVLYPLVKCIITYLYIFKQNLIYVHDLINANLLPK